jgi:hypothetical protein
MRAPSRSHALLAARLILVLVGAYSAALAVGPGPSAPAVILPGAR